MRRRFQEPLAEVDAISDQALPNIDPGLLTYLGEILLELLVKVVFWRFGR